MRVLVGYENKRTFVNSTNTKKAVAYQFWYPGRNTVIKEYKHIKDNYPWNDENEGELVYSKPAKSKCSPKIYNLQTPLKNPKSNNNDSNTVSIMSSDTSSKIEKNKRGVHN